MWEFELVEKLARLKPDDGFFNDLAVIWFRCDSCEWFIAVRQFHVYFNLHVWGSVEVGGQVTLWCLRGEAGGGAVCLVTNTVVLSVKVETHFISLFMGYNKSFVIRSLPLKQTGIFSQNCVIDRNVIQQEMNTTVGGQQILSGRHLQMASFFNRSVTVMPAAGFDW